MVGRFFRKRSPIGADEQQAATPWTGDQRLEVKGEASYQDVLEALAGGRTDESANTPVTAVLRTEPDNPYDPNAIAVYAIGGSGAIKVGHLPREIAAKYVAAVRNYEQETGKFIALEGTIVGGWDRGPNDQGKFGIWLRHNPADFT